MDGESEDNVSRHIMSDTDPQDHQYCQSVEEEESQNDNVSARRQNRRRPQNIQDEHKHPTYLPKITLPRLEHGDFNIERW